jgi:signal transduction histidine kinase/HAMP domain-containing protein
MKILQPASIRNSLLYLGLIVLLPFLGILLYTHIEGKQFASKNAAENTLRVAKSLSELQLFFEESTRQLLSVIAEVPDVKQNNFKETNKLLTELLAQNPAYASLLIVDSNGNLINAGNRIKPINVSDRKYFIDVQKTKAFSVGEFTISRLTNKPVLHYAYPVLNNKKQIQSVLIAGFDLNKFEHLFQNAKLGNEAILTIVDRNGVCLYSSTNNKVKKGTRVNSDILKNISPNSNEGVFEAIDNKGTEILFAYQRIQLNKTEPYMYITVGIPKKVAFAEYNFIMYRNIVLWALTAFLVIFFVYRYLRRNILQNIDRLVENSKQLAKGNLSSQTGLHNLKGELGVLARSFDEMAKTIASRDEERNETLKTLEKLKERFELAVSSANIGIWDWYINEDFLIWDENMFVLYEASPEDYLPNIDFWKSRISPDDTMMFSDLLKTALTDKKPVKGEFKIMTVFSGIKHIRIVADIIRDKQDNPVRMIGVNWDITERTELEQNIMVAREKAEQSDMLKSSFLANMSHEIRTPLNGIIGFSQLLSEDQTLSDNNKKYIDIIVASGNNLLNLVNDILDISIIESGQLKILDQECDLNSTLNKLHSLFKNIIERQNRNIDLILNCDSDNLHIITDINRLNQIVTNLIGNAIKFTEKGNVTFGYKIVDGHILFFVKDTGIGISKENHKKIFDRFKQADENTGHTFGGTGLGLAISRSLVERMGGKIWLESELDKGSSFYFTLPYRKVVPAL